MQNNAPDTPLGHLLSKLKVAVGQYTSAGIKAVNEDAVGLRIPGDRALTSKGVVAVIADGVSAAEAGREASNTAVTSFIADYYSTHDTWSVEHSASRVLTALNRWLYSLNGKYLRADKGYVTTFSAAVFKSASVYLFHVGDSRIYRIRDGAMEQLTQDHTTFVGKHQAYLARALGIDVHLDVDFQHLELRDGDMYVFTTDGVHDWLDCDAMLQVLGPSAAEFHVGTLDPLCQQLVDKARERGSDDNLSVQVVRIQSVGTSGHEDLLASVRQLPFLPPLEKGQVIDGWKVLKELHASARSEVYLVEHGRTGKRAALKSPSRNHEDDPSYIERFILEEWIGRRINSTHVVKVIKPDVPRNFLYYLTEYVEGPTLGQLLKERTQLSVVDSQNIIVQVISGLRAFHRKDVLHQDIKPDNIIYTEQGVKIIDFGSCYSAGIGEIQTRISHESQLGTQDYCAPEYLLHTPASPQSDQFSLAILLYELLTGQLPFGDAYRRCHNENDFARLKYTPASTINPLVPVWLDGAIQRALDVDPAQRYPALSEFSLDIKNPNPALLARRNTSARNVHESLALWRVIAFLLLMSNVFTLLLWLGQD